MFTDCHAHVFNMGHVPDRLLWLRLNLSDRFLFWLSNKLSVTIRGKKDLLENIASFSKHLSQTVEENYLDLMSYYPEGASVCLLLMDMRQIKGNIKTDYDTQIREMLDLQAKYKNIRLFVHLDPNNVDILKYLSEFSFAIDGIKVYPPLNSIPTHDSFKCIWEMAEENEIPVITHCGLGGVSAGNFFKFWKQSYAHPKFWRPVLEKHPNLKLNLSHFGEGLVEWQNEIIDLCESYTNVYTDTSFILGSHFAINQLKQEIDYNPVLNKKLLYGSDFYMTDLLNYNLEDNLTYLKTVLGLDLYKKITEENPINFFHQI